MTIYPIRVLHVLAAMNRAGTETLLMNYYRFIDKDKIQFDFAVSDQAVGDYDEEILNMGGKMFRYPAYTVYNHLEYKKWWNKFFIDHPEYKIVHGHIGSTAAIYLKIAKKHGCFAIAHSHSASDIISFTDLIYKIYAYPTRRIADYFFGCSKDALIDRYGKNIANDYNKAAILKNSIDAECFVYSESVRKEVRKELNIAIDDFIVGTVGRLNKAKNPLGIVEIIKRLRTRTEKFRFLWIGRGELENDIKRHLKEENLEECVLMIGVRSDVNRVMQAMDVFILPSLYEGLGNVLIEAQAAGLPSFCSDKVPTEAKITDLYKQIPLNDYDSWIDAILNADIEHRRNTYSEIVAAHYDVKQNAAELQEFYIKIYNKC